jgi:spermidine/putrescine transport system permease protein
MKKLSKIYLGLMLAFLYLPILLLVLFSFNTTKSHAVFSGFTLEWYRKLFQNEMIMTALGNTMIVAVVASVIATVLGTAAAIGIHKMKRVPKTIVMEVTNIPMINPDIITGISMMLVFVFVGKMFGAATSLNFWTILIAHVTFCLPYVIFQVLPKLQQTDSSLVEAAQDLGCNKFMVITKIILPLSKSGIISGITMVFVPAISTFYISQKLGGTNSRLIGEEIEAAFMSSGDKNFGSAISLVLMILIMLSIAVMNKFSDDEEDGGMLM